MKKVLTLLLLVLSTSCPIYAQRTIYYGYDAAGNRISRELRSQPAKGKKKMGDNDEVWINGNQIRIKLNGKDGNMEIHIDNWTENDAAAASVYSLDGKVLMSTTANSPTILIPINDSFGKCFVLTVRLNGIGCSWKIVI